MTKATPLDPAHFVPSDETRVPSRDQLLARYRQRIESESGKRLQREELEQLALYFVDRLKSLNSQSQSQEEEIRGLCQAELALLEEGYPQSSIAGRYLGVYRKAVQTAIADGSLPLTDRNSINIAWTKLASGDQGITQTHYALVHLKYDAITYAKLRQQSTGANNIRQDNLQIVCLADYLAQAQVLLNDDDPIHQAIGLCALTGRRHTEIVAKGRFSRTKYPYTIHFEGQQKKEIDRPFEILTLIPAQAVMERIEVFRALPKIEELIGLNHDAPAIARFNARVNRAVKQYFQDTQIVPVVDGFKTVSIHRLRGLYGAIAIHYFCPEHRNEHRFLQHYLGHLLEDEGQQQPNATATQHYFHYRLCNETGKILTARGIKTMANGLPPVPDTVSLPSWPPIDVVHPDLADLEDVTIAPVLPQAEPDPRSMTAVGVAPVMTTDPRSDSTSPLDHSASATPDLAQALTNQSHTLAWLTRRLESLEDDLRQMRRERDEAIAASQRASQAATQLASQSVADQPNPLEPELQRLRQVNQQLTADLAQATAKLDRFRSLLDNSPSEPLAPSPMAEPPDTGRATPSAQIRSLPEDLAPAPTVPAIVPAIVPASAQPSAQPSVSKPTSRAQGRAMGIFLGIQDWNRLHPGNTFAVTAGLLEQSFGINRKAAKAFIDDNQGLLWEHHQSIGVSNERGHNRGKDAHELRQFIETLT
jgi:hypothetical protein